MCYLVNVLIVLYSIVYCYIVVCGSIVLYRCSKNGNKNGNIVQQFDEFGLNLECLYEIRRNKTRGGIITNQMLIYLEE